jgi:hypothetical protein
VAFLAHRRDEARYAPKKAVARCAAKMGTPMFTSCLRVLDVALKRPSSRARNVLKSWMVGHARGFQLRYKQSD